VRWWRDAAKTTAPASTKPKGSKEYKPLGRRRTAPLNHLPSPLAYFSSFPLFPPILMTYLKPYHPHNPCPPLHLYYAPPSASLITTLPLGPKSSTFPSISPMTPPLHSLPPRGPPLRLLLPSSETSTLHPLLFAGLESTILLNHIPLSTTCPPRYTSLSHPHQPLFFYQPHSHPLPFPSDRPLSCIVLPPFLPSYLPTPTPLTSTPSHPSTFHCPYVHTIPLPTPISHQRPPPQHCRKRTHRSSHTHYHDPLLRHSPICKAIPPTSTRHLRPSSSVHPC